MLKNADALPKMKKVSLKIQSYSQFSTTDNGHFTVTFPENTLLP